MQYGSSFGNDIRSADTDTPTQYKLHTRLEVLGENSVKI